MGKSTINELMGAKGKDGKSGSLSLDDLSELLGERMPKLEFTPVGRLRLVTALRNRFGNEYRNLPGIDGIMKEFEDMSKHQVKMMEMKLIKGKQRK